MTSLLVLQKKDDTKGEGKEPHNPLHRTQSLATRLLTNVASDPTAGEIAKQAIAIFCEVVLEWFQAVTKSHLTTAVTKSTKNAFKEVITELEKKIEVKIKDVAANFVMKDIENTMGKEFADSDGSCAAAARSSVSYAELRAKDSFYSIVGVLHTEMVEACKDFTNKLLTSDEFKQDLSETGLIEDEEKAPETQPDDSQEIDGITQHSQKCMRCGNWLLTGQVIVQDPKFKHCLSHIECIPGSVAF